MRGMGCCVARSNSLAPVHAQVPHPISFLLAIATALNHVITVLEKICVSRGSEYITMA